MRTPLSSLFAFVALCGSCLLTGCGMGSNAVPAPQSLAVSGTVYGGALPINGSHIYLYAANPQIPSGPGIAASSFNASQSLLVAAANTTRDAAGHYYVTGGASGQFSLSGDYAACATGQQLYIYATGGNARGGDPTLTGGNNGVNAAIGLMSDLGECSRIGAGTKVTVNEASTVAAAYALSGFATDPTHIGDDEGILSNNTAMVAKAGMANAFANAKNLVTLAGTVLTKTPGGNGTVPYATVNTIANILANCVQSSGPSSKGCGDLFSFTGTATTADTATAAINLAHDPLGENAGSNGGGVSTSAALFADIEANTGFVPNLSTAPFDYSLAILYTGTGIQAPVGVAVDANGSVWIADSGSSSVVELSGTNASYAGTQFTGGGLSTPTYIAIDQLGSAWATNPGSVTQVTNLGATNYTASASSPTDVAIDGSNRVWVSDGGGNPVVFTPIGGTYAPTALPVTGGNYVSVSVDANEYVYLANTNYTVLRYPAGPLTSYLLADFSRAPKTGIGRSAINNDGSLWTETYKNSFSVITFLLGGGAAITSTAIDTDLPAAFIFDALGKPWAACNGGGYVCHLDTAGSGQLVFAQGSTGDGSSGTVVTGSTNQLAFDNAGNLWVTNSNNVAEFVGAGPPVVTPLVGAVVTNKISARP